MHELLNLQLARALAALGCDTADTTGDYLDLTASLPLPLDDAEHEGGAA